MEMNTPTERARHTANELRLQLNTYQHSEEIRQKLMETIGRLDELADSGGENEAQAVNAVLARLYERDPTPNPEVTT
jgi:hypothetical protein